MKQARLSSVVAGHALRDGLPVSLVGWGVATIAIAAAAGRQMYRRGVIPALYGGSIADLCGKRATLPGRLMASALRLNGGMPAIERMPEIDLDCALGKHAKGDHCGFVLSLEWEGTGSVWGHWSDGSMTVHSLSVLPSCLERSEGGRYFCGRIATHRGGHDWRLAEVADEDESLM